MDEHDSVTRAGIGSGITVGIDIGTTSVKAVAVDATGHVVGRARVVHGVRSPAPDQMEHDIDLAWRANVLEAYRLVREQLEAAVTAGELDDATVVAVNVAAMVPSLGAVDADGRACAAGLLYGDARGGPPTGRIPSDSGEFLAYAGWLAAAVPDAAGYWPAQSVANHALGGVAALDTVSAMTTLPLFDYTGWDAEVAASIGVRPDQLPTIVPGTTAIGHTADGATIGPGTIDAFAEQLVAGADHDGDVLVILGTTLIIWAVIPEWREVPGLWTVPHTAPGLSLIGGASNAGGLFVNWALGLLGSGPDGSRVDGSAAGLDPERIPVWEPYVRGERTPWHDAQRRAVLHDLDLTHGPAEIARAAYEASAFVVAHHLDLATDGAGCEPRRIVATGGGVRVAPWVQAVADATGLPVDVVAVPEGGALGAAYLARVTAGLEDSAGDAGRWARTSHRVDPDPAWQGPTAARYRRFRAWAGGDR